MHPLDEARRRRLLAVSAVCCAVPLCLLPLAGRSSIELAAERAAFDTRFAAPRFEPYWHKVRVEVARDPFVPEAPEDAGASLPAEPPDGVVGMRVGRGAPTGFVLDRPQPVTVTATVVGASPRALVDDGGRVRVVGIGDRIEGALIVSIDGTGVKLANGSVLHLAEGSP